jgi:WW domain-containing oxidoreductase
MGNQSGRFGSKSTAEEVSEGVDLKDKVIIVTGANCGLGEESARVFAMHGATVIMACRTLEKGETAAEKIRAASEAADVRVMQLDLNSLKSVKKFSENFSALGMPLHILLNNAFVFI